MSSEYSDVIGMFRDLRQHAEDSEAFARQRENIVKRCLPLADNVARRYNGRGEPLQDLTQVARLGLVKAVNRFDEEAGSDFISYAVPTIMGEVRRHFRDHGWAMNVPRRLKELHLRLSAASAELSQRLGRAPTASELAVELEMDRDEVIEGLVAGSSYSTKSIDSGGSGDDEDFSLADRMGDDDPMYEQVEARATLRPMLAQLPERDRAIVVMRFFENMTQSQIAERVGVSQMQVSRLLAKSLAQLREQTQ